MNGPLLPLVLSSAAGFGYVLAQAGARTGLGEWRRQLVWALPAIAALLLVSALVIAWLKRWRDRPTHDRLTASDQLAHFRTLYERGELSPEEFERVRGLLTERIRQDMAAAVGSAMPSASPASPGAPLPHTPPSAQPDGGGDDGAVKRNGPAPS